MPKTTANYEYTQNRELSWLRFNRRVLEEANDPSTPLLERLKFVSIFSSNLDEFFMVRVGSLFDIAHLSPNETDSKTGMTAEQQLSKIYNTVPGLIKLKKQIYASVEAELTEHGICDKEVCELATAERQYISRYYKATILPVLSPVIIDSHHPVPHLANKQLYAAAMLRDRKNRCALGIVPIPGGMPAYVKLENTDLHYVRIENIVLQWISTLFGDYRMEESCILSATRNADVNFDDDKFEDNEGDFRLAMTKLLRKRDKLSVVRLELDKKPSGEFRSLLMRTIQVEERQIFIDPCPLNMRYVYQLVSDISASKSQRFSYTPYRPRWPEDISRAHNMIEQIQAGDKLLFYPFDSVEPFLQLLNEAAEHDDVISIKITIYRLASSSKIARILCRAAENGKEVIVMMELRARFDEANNISWSRVLEDAGCQVIYGVEDFKCHSKICLITLRSGGKLHYITQIGTGNYNEKTNAMYTDLSLMTASDTIGEDGAAFFRNMLVSNLKGDYRELLVAPAGMKSTLLSRIDEQTALGPEGYICIKANAITEREVIDKLTEASRAGVEIQLIIRGICCILPGVPVYTENISITSIVGRFLEHARIYCFGKGAGAKFYISSADLMTRNLNRRVEIACPVHDPEICEQLEWILNTQLRDNSKASFMMSDGIYSRKQSLLPTANNSQQQFMELSLHRQTAYVPSRQHVFKKLKKLLEKIPQIFSE